MKLFARLRSSKKSLRGKLFRYGWKITLLAVIAAGGFGVFLFYGTWAHTFDMKKVGEMPERNTVFDFDGKIYSRLAGANRLKVSLNEVSPLFIAAVLAREDARFYQHGGIDWRGILRALIRDVLSGSAKEGASSITQQLARNSLPLGGRTISRKLLEAMVALKTLSPAESEQAKSAKITPHPKRLPFIQENYAMDAVQRDLNLVLTQDQIDNGGLFIYTTLDPAVQNAAQKALETQLTKIEQQSNFHHPLKTNYQPPTNGDDSAMPYLQGAVVAIDNASGGIRGLVGGRD